MKLEDGTFTKCFRDDCQDLTAGKFCSRGCMAKHYAPIYKAASTDKEFFRQRTLNSPRWREHRELRDRRAGVLEG